MAWWREVLHAAAFPTSLGMLVGLWIASQEIGANRYFEQGLWRTALWMGSRESVIGAGLGFAAGALVAAAIALSHSSAALRERRATLAAILTAAVAFAIILLPTGEGQLLGRPAREIAIAAFLTLWAATTALLVSRTTEETRPEDSAEGVWAILVWLGYVIFLAHLQARVAPGVLMAYLACGGLLGAVAGCVLLGRLARLLAQAVGGRVRREVALRRLHAFSVTVLALGLVLWLGGVAETMRTRTELARGHPNLVIIAVDTLRADRVNLTSKPDAGWDLTPSVRKYLAPRGTLFMRAYSQAPWTLPSFASVLTGLYPEEHGAQYKESLLLPHKLTLAEILRDSGYRTLAVVSTGYVSSKVGMLQGFDTTHAFLRDANNEITSRAVTDKALSFLTTSRRRPFFLFAHYYDPHWRYQDHEEFELADPKLRFELPPKLKVLPEPETYFSPPRFAKLKALYAEEIAFTDLHLGRLLAYLDENRLWDSTCVVFVADHGEEFLEHGGFEHGETLFEEMVHVPLLVSLPAQRAPQRSAEVVETRWLFGTLLNVLGIRRTITDSTAQDVFSPPQGESYARSSLYYGQLSCLTGVRYKLIAGPGLGKLLRERGRNQKTDRESKEERLLFDLLKDPGEKQDLSQEQPEVTRRLRSTLETVNGELEQRRETAPMPRMGGDLERQLKALGYL
jgi:arylsulfatase A-like enzyme